MRPGVKLVLALGGLILIAAYFSWAIFRVECTGTSWRVEWDLEVTSAACDATPLEEVIREGLF